MTNLDFDSWDVLTSADHATISDLNKTDTAIPSQTVVESVLEVAERYPDRIAVEIRGETVTYERLVTDARHLAAGLYSRGVRAGTIVMVRAEKRLDLYPLLLAILAQGAVVAAIDPQAPPQRITRCCELVDPHVVINVCQDDATTYGDITSIDVSELDDPSAVEQPFPASTLNDAAYITFTSGTTGTPRPVLNGHRGLANLISAYTKLISVAVGDRVTQAAPIHFDASWQQIFAAWTTGSTLLPVPDDIRVDPEATASWVIDNSLTHWDSVPSMWYPLVNLARGDHRAGVLRRLTVVLAGEALRREAVTSWLSDDNARVVNVYGPSEASIDATAFIVDKDELAASADPIPIGRPLANTRCYVLNESMTQCPIGVVGQLYLGGIGIAMGYVGDPATTAQRFVPDPFSNEAGARMYATGDLVRLTSAGILEFKGRTDEVVKVRGVRVNLAEVSGSLTHIPGITRAAVVLDEAHTQMVAYIVGDGPEDGTIYSELAESLPPSYLPSRIIRLDSLPLTTAGKVDMTALKRDAELVPSHEGPTPCDMLTPAQDTMARIWRDVLRCQVGLDDNFFALGGDSITSIVVRDRAIASGLHFEIIDLFRGPTVRQLTSMTRPVEKSDTGPDLADGRFPLLPGQSSMYWAATAATDQAALCVQETYQVAGDIDVDDLIATANILVDRYPVLRASFGDDDGRPWQQIMPRDSVTVQRIDGDTDTVEAQKQESLRAIQIGEWPLFDLRVVASADDHATLIWTMHHVISDGWSHALLRNSLFSIYCGIRTGDASWMVDTNDDSYLESLQTASAQRQSISEGWGAALAQAVPTRLPSSGSKNPGQERVTLHLTPEQTLRLSTWAREHDCTVNTVVLGAITSVLERFLGINPITVLYVTSGRANVRRPEHSVGCFINTLPLIVDLEGASPTSAPERVQAALQDTMAHEHVSATDICRYAGVSSIGDLSQILFLFQSYPDTTQLDDLATEAEAGFSIQDYEGFESIQFPLTIVCHHSNDRLIFDLDHLTEHVDTGLIEAFAEQLDTFLSEEMTG